MGDKGLNKPWLILFICFIVAALATAGSLFFSEVMKFPPCAMCWYQRICMYPLVLLFLLGLYRRQEAIIFFTLPLASIGWFFAAYHNLLHWGIVPEAAAPCAQGVSCSTVYVNWLGFISIPLLSLLAFSIIIGLLAYLHFRGKHE